MQAECVYLYYGLRVCSQTNKLNYLWAPSTADHFVCTRGGRSHFFRLRSYSKIFESGSGYSSNLRIRLLFRLRLQSSIQP